MQILLRVNDRRIVKYDQGQYTVEAYSAHCQRWITQNLCLTEEEARDAFGLYGHVNHTRTCSEG